MKLIEVVTYDGGSTFRASINGQLKATGNSALLAVTAVARLYPRNMTIYAPAVMSQPMKAGDIIAQGSLNGASFPAYTSTFQ